jgi:hypothetical protein
MANLNDLGARNSAIAKAREALGLEANHPAHTWSVARINPDANSFLLVVFGTPQAAVGIATIDQSSGEILAKATLSGRQPHLLISAEEAKQRAGFDAHAEAILVWDPTKASHSPFYPLWQLHDSHRTVWVDSVRGTIWKSLDALHGGGTVRG